MPRLRCFVLMFFIAGLATGCAMREWLHPVPVLPDVVYRPSQPGIGAIYAASYALYANAWAGSAVAARIVEVPAWEDYKPGKPYPVVWEGTPGAELAMFPRFDGARDRLDAKFQLVSAQGQPLGEPHYVDHFTAISARRELPPRPTSPKGLHVKMLDDAVALGVKTASFDLLLDHWIDWEALAKPDTKKKPRYSFAAGNETIPLRAEAIEQFDTQLRDATRAGMWCYPIVLQWAKTDTPNPMRHPRIDLTVKPTYSAWFVGNERAAAWFRGWIGYLAERYTRPDNRHGRIAGLVLGNEVNSHREWNAMGPATLEQLVSEYAAALRIADRELRLRAPDAHVFIPLDHFWCAPPPEKPGYSVPGRDFLDALNGRLRREGDIPWALAYHPYPQDLFNPRAWNDVQAIPSLATPIISFHNMEVLTAYLRQPGLQFEGKPRRLALTEQGCHTPDGPDGEVIQAAGFAYAWQRVRQLPEIEAFTYHRHVDHRDEGGLRLGLWARKQTGDDPEAPEHAKQIHAVFKAADTPDADSTMAFALPLIGIRDWSEARIDPLVEITSPTTPVLTLVENGSSRYRIVLADDATQGDRNAAMLLSECLARITGTTLRVMAESELAPDERARAIHVGLTQFAREQVLPPRRPMDGSRGVLLRSAGESVILLGDSTGPNDAAQVFLERYCGVGWFGHGRLATPVAPTLRLPEINWAHTPPAAWLDDKDWRERRFLSDWPPVPAAITWNADEVAKALRPLSMFTDFATAQQAWDPKRNARALEYEAYQAWYGAGGEPMLRYQQWLAAEQRRAGSDAALLQSSDTIKRALQLLDDARDAAQQSSPAVAPIMAYTRLRTAASAPPDATPDARVLRAMLPWWLAQLEQQSKTPATISAAIWRSRLADLRQVLGEGVIRGVPPLAMLDTQLNPPPPEKKHKEH